MLNILVIDDERPTLSMFRLFLSAYGYNVNTAENGEKGLEIFNRVKPEIVFTDLKMPGMDGLEVLKRIRESDIDSQVIIITGHGDMDKAVKALDLDAADFINKPVEREALDAALLRAERRIDYSLESDCSIKHSLANNTLTLEIKGKITKDSKEKFSTMLTDIKIADISFVTISFDSNFSINRDGISSLMEFLNTLQGNGAATSLTGLSYNFRKIFQMVGIHRSAEIDDSDG